MQRKLAFYRNISTDLHQEINQQQILKPDKAQRSVYVPGG
jgi:hypothetical protein